MPKTQPLCTGAKSSLGDRVLGEVEKNSFIALPGKGGHSGPVPSKTVCPYLAWGGGFGEEFYSNGLRVGLPNHDLLWNEECFIKQLTPSICWRF